MNIKINNLKENIMSFNPVCNQFFIFRRYFVVLQH